MNTKNKFNIIDVIIIITVLLIIGVSVFRAVNKSHNNEYTKKDYITYTVSVNELDSEYIGSIKTGDELYISDKETICGTVSDIKTKYAYDTVQVYAEDGTVSFKKVINPSKVNITLSVDVTANITDSMLYAGKNTYISKGQKVEFYTDTFTFKGIVVDFNVNEAE